MKVKGRPHMFPIRTQDISILNRIRMALAFFGVVKDVYRTDEVFKVSERIPDEALEPALGFLSGPWAKKALAEQTLLRPDLNALAELPVGTLGREYADFMNRRGLKFDFYPKIPMVTPIKFFRIHLYQTHDLWHIVTGFRADPTGELGLQAFYLAQTHLPLPMILIAAGLLNAVLFQPSDAIPRIEAIVKGWNMGKVSEQIFGFPWATHWSTPLKDVRKMMAIETYLSAVPELGVSEPLASNLSVSGSFENPVTH